MITLLGTGHVFDLRRRVQEEIYRRSPEVIALELDPPRFAALKEPEQANRHGPAAYRLLAKFQQRMADSYGVKAGDEMLAAADAARDLRVPIALIDRDARVVFRRVWAEMRFREKARLAGALLASAVMPSKRVEEDLAKMQSDYAAVFAELGEKFPTIRRIVLDERDEHMARALAELRARHATVLAVVGDGHVDGLVRHLEGRGLAVESVRLQALRGPERTDPTTEPASVNFRVEYDL